MGELVPSLFQPSKRVSSADSLRNIHCSRLPTETLVEIFTSFSYPDSFPPETNPPPRLFRTELERLANSSLLTLSQVCSRWHAIVINTPMFWSRINLHGVLWRTPASLEKTAALLTSALDRGRDSPITLMITDESNMPPPSRIFHLLSQHSHRWRMVDIVCSMDGVDLSGLKGKLPRVKQLVLSLPKISSPRSTVDFFDGAPDLHTLAVSSPLLDNVLIPFQRLRGFGCEAFKTQDIDRAISILPRLTNATDFYLSFHADRQLVLPNWTIILDITPVTCTILRFFCAMFREFHPQHSRQMLGAIFSGLTLPMLEELLLESFTYPCCVLEWPHAQFLSLCWRSGFQRCLKLLRLAHVRITDEELIQVLSPLRVLEHLEIADQHTVNGEGVDHVLVTDNLLRTMTWTPSNQLFLPRLRSFVCTSRLEFTHILFVDFVGSRVQPVSTTPFRVELRLLGGWRAGLDSSVHTGLQGLASRDRQLVYEIGQARRCPRDF